MVRHGQTKIEFGRGEIGAEDRKRIRFHCRFQTEVYEYYRSRPRGISKTIRHALARFRLVVNGGLFRLERLSRFLSRTVVRDKIELRVRLTVEDKDLLEKLAFAFRLSQAEVLRMALEWYMEAVNVNARQCVYYAARRKWHHRRPNPEPFTLRYSFWDPGRLLEWRFPQDSAVKAAYHAIRDIWPNRFIRKDR